MEIKNFLNIVIFIGIGFILFLLELFTPGFGIPGIVGLLFIFLGCYFLIKVNLWLGILASLLSTLLVILFFKFFARSKFWQKIQLRTKENSQEGYSIKEDLDYLLGKTGKTLTPLKPIGVALIEGKRLNVVSEAGFIEKDKEIIVAKVEENKIIVREK